MVKCPNCGIEMKKTKEKKKIQVVFLTEDDEIFLRESNAIEREFSDIAPEDVLEIEGVKIKEVKGGY